MILSCNRKSTPSTAPENRKVSNGLPPSVAHRGSGIYRSATVMDSSLKTSDKNGGSRGVWRRPSANDRFLSYINKLGGVPDHVPGIGRCWIWTGGYDGCGYGAFWINGKTERASRVSYRMFIGDFQETLNICHRCDNPKCVNPKHLFTGTHQDNVADRHSKGRTRTSSGEGCWASKLKPDDVLFIRDNYKPRSVSGLISQFGISYSTLQDIIKKRTWKHL